MQVYTVVVGNIGTVYNGISEADAVEIYTEYCLQSLNGIGRVADEPVTLLIDNEEKLCLSYSDDEDS